MIALLLCQAAVPVLAVPGVVFADAGVTASVPRLAWPAAAAVRVEEHDGELVARFDRPLAEAAIDRFRAAGGAAIGDLRWNDDSLVLRAAPGWAMTWRQAGPVVTVEFAASGGGAVVADDDGAVRDVALAAIEADAAAGYPGQARRAAAVLAARYPGDRGVARLRADTRAADGDVRGAAQEYRALAATDRAARRTMAAAPGIASVAVTARDGGDLSQVEAGVRVDAAIGRRATVGGGVRHVASRVDTGAGVVRAGTTVIDAAAGVTLGQTVRVQAVASSAPGDDVTGGGVRVTIGSAEAQFRTGLVRHMPDFSTTTQVLAGGYLSRGLVGVTYRLTPGLIGQAELGANRYGLAGMDGASDTVTASAGLDYLIRRQFPALGLTYRFEAEYVERMRMGVGGTAIVPLVDRENHTVQGLVSGTVGAVQLTGLAGWTVDRFGGDGPTASLGVAVPIGIAWRIEGSGGITSIARPGFGGRQVFGRVQVSRSLGDGR